MNRYTIAEGPARNRVFERRLKTAIDQRRLVAVRYEGDRVARLFAPHTLYRARSGKVLVLGTQVNNPGRVYRGPEVRSFEVAKVEALRPTGQQFLPDARIVGHVAPAYAWLYRAVDPHTVPTWHRGRQQLRFALAAPVVNTMAMPQQAAA